MISIKLKNRSRQTNKQLTCRQRTKTQPLEICNPLLVSDIISPYISPYHKKKKKFPIFTLLRQYNKKNLPAGNIFTNRGMVASCMIQTDAKVQKKKVVENNYFKAKLSFQKQSVSLDYLNQRIHSPFNFVPSTQPKELINFVSHKLIKGVFVKRTSTPKGQRTSRSLFKHLNGGRTADDWRKSARKQSNEVQKNGLTGWQSTLIDLDDNQNFT